MLFSSILLLAQTFLAFFIFLLPFLYSVVVLPVFRHITPSSPALFQIDRKESLEGTEDGDTALHLAIRQGHQPVVETLLQCRADPLLRAQDGTTALQLASGNVALMDTIIPYVPFRERCKEYTTAACESRTELLFRLLKSGVDVNFIKDPIGQDEMFGALHYAAQDGNLLLTQKLLEVTLVTTRLKQCAGGGGGGRWVPRDDRRDDKNVPIKSLNSPKLGPYPRAPQTSDEVCSGKALGAAIPFCGTKSSWHNIAQDPPPPPLTPRHPVPTGGFQS